MVNEDKILIPIDSPPSEELSAKKGPRFSVNKKLLASIFIPLAILLAIILAVGVYGYFTVKTMLPTITALQTTGSGLVADFQG